MIFAALINIWFPVSTFMMEYTREKPHFVMGLSAINGILGLYLLFEAARLSIKLNEKKIKDRWADNIAKSFTETPGEETINSTQEVSPEAKT